MGAVVNYMAVLVAAVVSFAIGAAWYSPMLFAKPWMKATGANEGSMQKGGMGSAMVRMFIALLVTGYVLAHFSYYLHLGTAMAGAKLGVWAWLGFVATFALNSVLFERRSRTWFWIVTGYQLVSLVVMGMIIAAWR